MKKILLFLFLSLNLFAGGSRIFNGSSEYFVKTSAIITALPITFCTWASIETASGTVLGITKTIDNTVYTVMIHGTGQKLRAQNSGQAGDTRFAESSNTYTLNSWTFACANHNTTSSRSIYVGGTKTTDTASNTASPTNACDRTTLGVLIRLAIASYFDGSLGHAGFWNVTLTDTEVNELYLGIPAIYVRTNSCKAYYPLMEDSGNALDKSGLGNTLTDTDTVGASSSAPRIFIPSGGQ